MSKKIQSGDYEIKRDKDDMIMVSCNRINICQPHYHKQIELFYCNTARQKVFIDQKKLELKKGDFIIIYSYTLHSYLSKTALNSVICVPNKYTKLFDELRPANFQFTLIKGSGKTRKIYREMRKLYPFNKVNNYKKDSLFYSLLSAVTDIEEIELHSENNNELYYKIVNYFNDNYSDNISLDSLAYECGYSKNYISSIFNKTFHCSFNEYLNLRRLQVFIELQSEPDNSMSITETALTVGFNSPRTFFNAFKNHFNMPPKEYLSKIKK